MTITGIGVEVLPHPVAKRAGEGVLAAFAPFTRDIPEDAGDAPIIRFAGNTSTEDRYGSIILPRGARMQHYNANPVFMRMHDYSEWPLGQSLETVVTDTLIAYRVLFAVNEHEEAAIAYRLYKGDFVRGVSIGMLPLKWERYDAKTIPVEWAENRIYVDWEHLELSAAPIPANRYALKMALDQGVASENEIRAAGLEHFLAAGCMPYLLFSRSIAQAAVEAARQRAEEAVPPLAEPVTTPRAEPVERVGAVLSRANREALETAAASLDTAVETIRHVLAAAQNSESNDAPPPVVTDAAPAPVTEETHSAETAPGDDATAEMLRALLRTVNPGRSEATHSDTPASPAPGSESVDATRIHGYLSELLDLAR